MGEGDIDEMERLIRIFKKKAESSVQDAYDARSEDQLIEHYHHGRKAAYEDAASIVKAYNNKAENRLTNEIVDSLEEYKGEIPDLESDNDNYYIKKDLIDYADLDQVIWHNSYDRQDAISSALPEHADVSFKRSGGYEGEYALVVRLAGYLWVETGYYGSCGGCDAFLAHKREEVERILRDAYCFVDVIDLYNWAIESHALEMNSGGARQQLAEALDELGPHTSG